SAQVSEIASSLYNSLTQSGIEVLWDDRDERAGVKFNDADLIGAPYQLIIGDKGLAQGTVEFKLRKDGTVTRLAPDQVLKHAQTLLLDSSRAR
ncbi:MAG: proline--tRNA ligase, partial [Nitrospirae bacterium]